MKANAGTYSVERESVSRGALAPLEAQPRRRSTALSHAGIKIAASHLHRRLRVCLLISQISSPCSLPRGTKEAREAVAAASGDPRARPRFSHGSPGRTGELAFTETPRGASPPFVLYLIARKFDTLAIFRMSTNERRDRTLVRVRVSIPLALQTPFFSSFLSDVFVSSEHLDFFWQGTRRRSAERRIRRCSPNSGSDSRAIYLLRTVRARSNTPQHSLGAAVGAALTIAYRSEAPRRAMRRDREIA